MRCSAAAGPRFRHQYPWVFETIATLAGVEPLAWLTDVLERMVSGRTKAPELERLLPWTWQTEQRAAATHV
jgi:hypothetical protein